MNLKENSVWLPLVLFTTWAMMGCDRSTGELPGEAPVDPFREAKRQCAWGERAIQTLESVEQAMKLVRTSASSFVPTRTTYQLHTGCEMLLREGIRTIRPGLYPSAESYITGGTLAYELSFIRQHLEAVSERHLSNDPARDAAQELVLSAAAELRQVEVNIDGACTRRGTSAAERERHLEQVRYVLDALARIRDSGLMDRARTYCAAYKTLDAIQVLSPPEPSSLTADARFMNDRMHEGSEGGGAPFADAPGSEGGGRSAL
jgi:hypothetical protein